MTTFERGDEVRITIDATVRNQAGIDLFYKYRTADGIDFRRVVLDSDAVTVEHLPADPPPMERKPFPDRDDGIDVLPLSVRVHNCLMRNEVFSVGGLLATGADGLMDIRNFGPTALAEVQRVLAAHGLELRS